MSPRWQSPLERALSLIELKASGCWEWQRDHGHRYGRIFSSGRRSPAHKLLYEALIGPVPEGQELDHLCANKRCVNPTHLEPVTHRENVRRWSRSVDRPACPHGHPWLPGSYYLNRQSGSKVCLLCDRARKLGARAS